MHGAELRLPFFLFWIGFNKRLFDQGVTPPWPAICNRLPTAISFIPHLFSVLFFWCVQWDWPGKFTFPWITLVPLVCRPPVYSCFYLQATNFSILVILHSLNCKALKDFLFPKTIFLLLKAKGRNWFFVGRSSPASPSQYGFWLYSLLFSLYFIFWTMKKVVVNAFLLSHDHLPISFVLLMIKKM